MAINNDTKELVVEKVMTFAEKIHEIGWARVLSTTDGQKMFKEHNKELCKWIIGRLENQ